MNAKYLNCLHSNNRALSLRKLKLSHLKMALVTHFLQTSHVDDATL
jgi:hypothetical protein